MSRDRIVYSTDPRWKPPCKRCGNWPCSCETDHTPTPRRGEPVRLSFRRAHKGSGLTLIERLPLGAAEREELLRSLKRRLGVGGAIRAGVLELQGDHRDAVERELAAAGFKVRRIGG